MSIATADANPVDAGSSGAASEPSSDSLVTVRYDADKHRAVDFLCARSERVGNFLVREAPTLLARGYCKVFVLEDNDDPGLILGYFSLSAAIVQKANLSNTDEKRSPYGLFAPMARIGFIGRHDNAAPKLGAALLLDAVRRVARNEDIGVCGIVLECEGGKANARLWNWYLNQGFKPCRNAEPSMYAALTSFPL